MTECGRPDVYTFHPVRPLRPHACHLAAAGGGRNFILTLGQRHYSVSMETTFLTDSGYRCPPLLKISSRILDLLKLRQLGISPELRSIIISAENGWVNWLAATSNKHLDVLM